MPEIKKDALFAEKRQLIEDFNFGSKTAEVFDDMLDRSVPYYSEIQRMMGNWQRILPCRARIFMTWAARRGRRWSHLDKLLPDGCDLCRGGFLTRDAGEDQEQAEAGRGEARDRTGLRGSEQRRGDLQRVGGGDEPDAAIHPPLNRDRLVAGLVAGLNNDGCLILVEKMLSQNSTINRLFIKHYYEFKKRNGYSEMEISQKREALENVLIPYHFDENRELLLRNGFKSCDVFFRWYNFCGMLAIK